MTFDADKLMLYFGDDYVINDHIKIHQPTIGEIVDMGEQKYWGVIHTLTMIPSDVKYQLSLIDIDWMEIDDFECFMLFAPTLSMDSTSLLFGDIDFRKLIPFKVEQNDELALGDPETGLVIDKMIYLRIVNYLRQLHNITPKVERAANKMTRKILIEESKQKYEENSDKPFESSLLPLISSVKCRLGCTKEYIRNEGYYEFMEDVGRLQVIRTADSLLNGIYSGNIDGTKIAKDDLNWMRAL